MKPLHVRPGMLVAVCLIVQMTALPSAGQPRNAESFDPRDALLAALGTATLECLGTVGPSLYETQRGYLVRTFRTCSTGDARALGRIDALLGIQRSVEGMADGIAAIFTERWDAFTRSFPAHLDGACPRWTLEHVIDAPTVESVGRFGPDSRPGVQYARYTVSSTACHGRGCAAKAAAVCAKGFGSQFVVEADPQRDQVKIDPAWWLLDTVYDRECQNPFLTPGYYHAMSFYGALPGARYGAIQRAGEACSVYDHVAGKHRVDGKLIPIDCGNGWPCASYCIWTPTPQPPSPPRPGR